MGSLKHHQHLLFDGTFLHKPVSIVALMDGETNTVISGKFGVKENSNEQLCSFFKPLIDRELDPESCTTDGNPNVIRTLRTLWPGIITQRCLVHMQRQGLSWCRRSPKTVYGRDLRTLFCGLTDIDTEDERDSFIVEFVYWEKTFGEIIKLRKERGKVFSDVKRARSLIINALPDMFHYLDNPRIPRSTNGLEGYFSRLKPHYGQHRGLIPKKRANYFAWYFHYKPK